MDTEEERHRDTERQGYRETGIQTEIEMKTYTAAAGPPVIS